MPRIFPRLTTLLSVRWEDGNAVNIGWIDLCTNGCFNKEREVLRSKEDREREWSLVRSSSRDELQGSVLVKMKAVTKAEDDICIALLEENGYDLKTSIEAFFQSTGSM